VAVASAGHVQVCTSLQTDNHTSTPPLSFFTGRMPFLPPNQQRQSTEGNTSCKYIQLLFSAFITCSVVVWVYFNCNFVLLNPNAKLNNMLPVFLKLEDGCKLCPQISQISIAEMIEIAMDCCSHYCVLFLWFCLAVLADFCGILHLLS